MLESRDAQVRRGASGFFFLIGLGVCALMIVIGAVLWRGADRTNLDHISFYNEAVSRWTSDIRGDFSSIELQSCAVEGKPSKGCFTDMSKDSKMPPAEVGPAFSSYKPLVFKGPGASGHFDLQKAPIAQTVSIMSLTANRTVSSTVPLWRVLSRGRTAEVLEEVCFQMAFDNVLPCYGGQTVGIYRPVSITSSSTVDISFAVTVASLHDPRVVAAALTGGTLRFVGWSNAGLGLMVAGVLGLLFLAAVWLWNKRVVSSLGMTVVVALSSHAMFFGAGLTMEDHWSWQAVYEWSGWIGLLMMLLSGTSALIATIVAWNTLLALRWSHKRKMMVACASLLLCLALCIGSIFLIKPWSAAGVSNAAQDPLSALFGVFVFVVYFFHGLAFAAALVRVVAASHPHEADSALRHMSSEEGQALLVNDTPGVSSTPRLGSSWIALTAGFFLMAIFGCLLASVFLPPIWNVPFGSYLKQQSPFAWMTTAGDLVLKLYVDPILWYSIFFGGLGVALVVRRVGGVRWLWLPLVATLVGLFVAWLYYWVWGYKRIAIGGDSGLQIERVARASGHLCNALLALLLWPISRRSVWRALLKVPFDRAVIFHRWVATAFYASIGLHTILWIAKWAVQGQLINLVALHQEPHYDNFTVLTIIVVTVFVLTPMAISSLPYFRRNYHHIFFAIHHVFPIVFVASAIHSWALFIYFVPPLLMYLLDRALLQYRLAVAALSHDVRLVEATPRAGHTVLKLVRPFDFRPGQYAFVCFPDISLTEFHPFSLASSPQDETMTLVCKDMGEGSFTRQLASLAPESAALVDGPHGTPPSVVELCSNYSSLIFVAGGVGITPIASLLEALTRPAQNVDIHFIWCVRSAEMLAMLPWLTQIKDAIASIAFHVTQPDFEEDPSNATLTKLIVRGRPNLDELLDRASSKGSTYAFACGPVGLVKSVLGKAAARNIPTYTEAFEF